MPVTLDDDLTALLIRHLVSPPKSPTGTGAAILAVVQENQKLLRALQQETEIIMTTDTEFKAELASMQADMTAQTNVTNSLVVFVGGLTTQLAAAIGKAQDAGATADELADIKALHATLSSNTASIISAVTVNTPAASEPPAPIVPTPPADPVATTTGDDTGTAVVS